MGYAPKGGWRKFYCPNCERLTAVYRDGTFFKHKCNGELRPTARDRFDKIFGIK